MIIIKDIDLDNILLDERSYQNILIYDVAYKTAYDAKTLHNIFDKEDGYIREYVGTKYVALFDSDEKIERYFDRIRYLIMLKSNVSDIYSYKYTEVKVNSDDDLRLEKMLNMRNVLILIESVFLIKITTSIMMKSFSKNVDINNIKMLYYGRIEVSKRIDVNKTSALKECIIYHY